jgi:hypothetical protein
MTAISDTAALAAIGAAARELKLPTVRADAARLAEIAVRERQTHLSYLAEALSAGIDDRTGRRRTRRIAEARFPASSGWPTSTPTPSPASPPPSPPSPPCRRRVDRRRPAGRLARGRWHRQVTSAHRPGAGRLRARPPGPLRHYRRSGQRARRSRRQQAAAPRCRPVRPPGPAPARRAWLRSGRPARRRAAVPDHYRTGGKSLYRDRDEPAVQ